MTRPRDIQRQLAIASQALALLGLSILTCASRADLSGPPRFDGAGYAMLGRALGTGQGYRNIEHPDRPRHTHFPPGYPTFLAGLQRTWGLSTRTAHLASLVCTLAAILGFWAWFRTLDDQPAVAWLLGAALACNWQFSRETAVIRSEPLYLLLTALALWLHQFVRVRRGERVAPVVLGGLLGACVLTRHVGVMLAAACLIDLAIARRWQSLGIVALVTTLCVAPWVAWIFQAGGSSQVDLMPASGLPRSLASQAVFYAGRLPDQITGPMVEVATVFRPEYRTLAVAWTLAALGVFATGWWRLVQSPRRRMAWLVPATTLPLLLLWPFTEAGRFLIPLIPMLLIAGVEGLVGLASAVSPSWDRRQDRMRVAAATLLVTASGVYTSYSLATDRAAQAQRLHRSFDAACVWIKKLSAPPGVILTRYPAEVYWQTGRTALQADADDPAAIDRLVDTARVSLILVDGPRFARDAVDPLDSYAARSERFRRVWHNAGVSIYRRVGRQPSSPIENDAGHAVEIRGDPVGIGEPLGR